MGMVKWVAVSLPVVLTPDAEDGGFVARCPVLPGCISQGDTEEEAVGNCIEAIGLCIDDAASEIT